MVVVSRRYTVYRNCQDVERRQTLAVIVDGRKKKVKRREIFACMELPIMFECVLDYGVIAAKFLPNSIVRPAKINKLEDSPTFREGKWSI